MSPLTYESVTPDMNARTLEENGRYLNVLLPLTVTLGDSEIYCETADGYEVWHFHEDEFAEHADNIPRFVAESLTDPENAVEQCAAHIISDAMATDSDAVESH